MTHNFYVKVKLAVCVADLSASHHLQNIINTFRWLACQYCSIGTSDKLKEFNSELGKKAPASPLSESHVFADMNLEGRVFAPDIFHILNEGKWKNIKIKLI